MRKGTINIITVYLSALGLMNCVVIGIIFLLKIDPIEACLIMAVANPGFVMVSRDISRKHEQICNKNAHQPHGKTS